jgi:hypothetical protein
LPLKTCLDNAAVCTLLTCKARYDELTSVVQATQARNPLHGNRTRRLSVLTACRHCITTYSKGSTLHINATAKMACYCAPVDDATICGERQRLQACDPFVRSTTKLPKHPPATPPHLTCLGSKCRPHIFNACKLDIFMMTLNTSTSSIRAHPVSRYNLAGKPSSGAHQSQLKPTTNLTHTATSHSIAWVL